MAHLSVFQMKFSRVYACLVQKAEKKGRTKKDVDQIILWLTGYKTMAAIGDVTYGEFLSNAPEWNPLSEEIKGSVCGVKVQEITDPMTKRMRQLDKLVDDLSKGMPLERILKSAAYFKQKIPERNCPDAFLS